MEGFRSGEEARDDLKLGRVLIEKVVFTKLGELVPVQAAPAHMCSSNTVHKLGDSEGRFSSNLFSIGHGYLWSSCHYTNLCER